MTVGVESSAGAPQARAYQPQLTRAERDRRWNLVREQMARKGVDALVIWGTDTFYGMGMANFRYLTHIGSQMGGACIFPLAGDPIVYQAPPHMNIPFNGYRVAQAWVDHIQPFAGVPGVVAGLKERRLEQARLGLVAFGSTLVTNTLPQQVYRGLTEALPAARWSDETALVEQARLIKSPEEIAMLEQAGRLARQTVIRMHDAAVPGATEAEVYAAMLYEQIAHGGEPHTFNLMATGPIDGPADVWHLVHGLESPACPTRRPLAPGDLVISELHACWGGYLAAAESSVYLGRPPVELARIHQVAVECLHVFNQVMRPGRTLREVWEAVRRPCYAAGLDFVELGFHGHGLASPEWPTVVYKEGVAPLGGDGIGDIVLRENMVFGLNIDLFDPKWKPNVGVMLGDTVHVTPGEGRFLVQTPIDRFGKG